MTNYNLTQTGAQVQSILNDVANKAPIDSPNLTGSPTAPTPVAGTNTTRIATTAYVQTEIAGKAPLASPVFTGNPTAPTPSAGDNDTSIATTAFVDSSFAKKDSPVFIGTASFSSGAFTLNSSGIYTADNQPYFQGSFAGGVGANFVQPFASGQYISSGFTVDQPNGRLTAQIAGKYLVFWHQLVSCSGAIYFYVRKNGSAMYSAFTQPITTYDMSDCCIITMSVNDYLDFKYTGGIVTSTWSGNHSSLMVFKIA